MDGRISTHRELANCDAPSPHRSPRYWVPQIIVIHATVGSIKSALAWMSDQKSKVSCHWAIDRKGTIYKVVPESFVAWHAGRSRWKGVDRLNQLSIGIELENEDPLKLGYTRLQLETCYALCQNILRTWPIRWIVGHEHITKRKRDPGPKFPWKELTSRVKTRLVFVGKEGLNV